MTDEQFSMLPPSSTLIFLWDQPKPRLFGDRRIVRPLGTEPHEPLTLRDEKYYEGMSRYTQARLAEQSKRREVLLAYLRKNRNESFSVAMLRKRIGGCQSTMNVDLRNLMLQEYVDADLCSGRMALWFATAKKGEVE